MIRKKNINQIVQRALDYLEQNTDITMLNPGGTARALVDAVAAEMAGLYTILDRSMVQAFVSTASGVFLDLIAEMVGIRRRSEVAAYTSQSDKNVRFYVTSGAIRDYISTIPAGTTITSADGSVVFVTDEAYAVPANATQLYVTARAQTVGAQGNIGLGSLVSHNLGNSNVFVENREAITTASGIEDDRSLRQRIKYAVRSAEGSNMVAVRMAALSVPGVSDLIIHPYAMGSGSFEIILIPQGNRVATATLSDVRSAISQTVAFGINFVIREPRYVPVSVSVELVMPEVPDTLKAQHRNLVAGAIQRYVGSLRPGGTIVANRIRQAALSVSNRISDVTIRELRIYGRPMAVGNLKLKPDEIFIPDPDEAEPFRVR